MTDFKLSPESRREITMRARSLLKAARRRGLTTTRDLGYQLAATRMVLTVLEAQAEASAIPDAVLVEGLRLSEDLDTVIEFLNLTAEDTAGVAH